jgi:peptide/nickel transport system substrate-binding protein
MKKFLGSVAVLFALCASAVAAATPLPQPFQRDEQPMLVSGEPGQFGGSITVGQKAEPKTLNPVVAVDSPSREVIGRMNADLIHIDRLTQKTEPALAQSWKISPDGRTFTLKLRRGVRFSDGQPFTADDVIFTFRVYLDEKLHSPQRDLLMVGDKPIAVAKIDQYTVRFELAKPYAAAERIFDNVAILPEHLLRKSYEQGTIAQAWLLNAAPESVATLGPFRLKQYVPGQRIVLERNPWYWKADRAKRRLPYLDEMTFLFVGTEDAQVLRFEAHDTNVISRFGADNFGPLSREQQGRGYRVVDLGPSLEYNFLFFNQNYVSDKLPRMAAEQEWFRDLRFRQAVNLAVDRNSIVRMVFSGHAAPIWGNVTPGNKLWMNTSLPHPARSIEQARDILRSAGFSWNAQGRLLDAKKREVEFTIVASSSSAPRVKMATLVADDLSQLGMNVHVVPLEFRALVDRVFQSGDYEACVLGLGGGDADPNGDMNVWMSNGGTHLWNLRERKPATAWEAEIDRLINQQLVTMKYNDRKRVYDRVQQLIAENLPFIFLAAPDVLAGAGKEVGNFQPAALDPYVLWNADQLYVRKQERAAK